MVSVSCSLCIFRKHGTMLDPTLRRNTFLKKTNLTGLILLIMSVSTRLSSCKVLRSPVGDPYYVFGIGSACYQRSINQSSQFNLKARYHDKAVQYFFWKRDYNHPVSKHLKQFNYKYMDICESFEKLTSTFVDLLLDPRYTLTVDPSPIAGRKITSWKHRSKILVIFLYIEHDLFRLFSEIVSQTDILIMNLESLIEFPSNFFYTLPSRTLHSFLKIERLFKLFVEQMDLRYVTMVLVKEKFSISTEYFEIYYKLFRWMGICLNTVEILNGDFNLTTNSILQQILDDKSIVTILLLGSQTSQKRLLESVGYSNKTWLLNENYLLAELPRDAGTTFSFQDNFFASQTTTRSIYSLASNFFTGHLKFERITTSLLPFDYVSRLYQDLNFFVSSYHKVVKQTRNLFMLKVILKGLFEFPNLRIYADEKLIFSILNPHNLSSNREHLANKLRPYKRKNSCPAVQCSPGQEYVFKKLDINVSQWNESFQWTCQLCGPGFYKAIYGNTSCQLCPPLYMSNEKRDSCFDPYILKVISIGQPFTLVAIGLTCFGFMSCFGVLLAFIKYRNTPMMKAANVNMTLFHIVLIAVNFLLLLLAFYGEPSEIKCYCRLFAMTIFYTIIVGIILLRSQKVLKAFGSRIKLTKSEVRREFFGEIFFLLILVLVNNLILFIAVNIIPVQMLTILNSITYEKTPHCETWRHSNVLVGFSICLQFVCFIQAFRGRRLPGAFKETMSIVYGNFISMLVFITMYPIVVFQKDILMRESVFWIALTLNMNLLVMFCYFRRVYVAIFQPEKNTVEYSRSVIMAKMNKQARIHLNTGY